ncbi:MAG: TIGR01459 family HAD-type hydrolase [Terricaulis sp.]
MTELISSIDAIADRYDLLLCDVWGVIHNGRNVYAEAAAALQRLRAAGKTVVLITNVPKPRGPIPKQLDRIGCPRDAWDAVVTSGDAIRAALSARAPGPMYKIGPDYDHALWEGLNLDTAPLAAAAFVAISGLNDDNDTPEMYADIVREARARNLDMLCANPDIIVQFGDRMIWCAGAVARDYAAVGGNVIMAGKPYAPIYDLAFSEAETLMRHGIDRARVLAIGDGVGTDVKGANAQGIDCLFIGSGTHGENLLAGGALDQSKVDAVLAADGAVARYAMRALR